MNQKTNKTMKITRVIFPAICLLLSSCVYSLFPIYTEDTVRYLPEIMGKWETDEGYLILEPATKIESITVTSDDPKEDTKEISSTEFIELNESLQSQFKSYKMTIQDKMDSLDKFTFLAHLVEIGNDMFIDLYAWSGENRDDYRAANLFPVHTFMKFRYSNDELTLTHFKLSKLKDLFKSNLIRMRHEMVDGEVVITAQPKEIQKFLEKYSQDPDVLEKPSTYTRLI